MEVRVLLKLKGKRSINELADGLGLSISRTSVLVASLERKGLIKTEKIGRHKIVSLSDAKAAELFKRIVFKFRHMHLEDILTGKNLSLLAVLKDTPLSAYELCIKSNLSRSTFYHTIGRLSNYGIIGKKNGKYFSDGKV